MVAEGEFNAGSLLLAPISAKIGLPVDQLNFLACQLFALFLSYPFRRLLHPATVGPVLRHLVSTFVGLGMAYFCFGYQVIHLFALSSVSYACMRFLTPAVSNRVVLVFALSYLSIVHVYRMYYDYGGHTLDVTGPLMIMVQKVTALAYSIHDGTEPDDKLTDDQREQRCVQMPSWLEFYSYMFYFHGIMVGPMCFYADYKRFVEGKNYRKDPTTGVWMDVVTPPEETPSPLFPFLQKLVYTGLCAYVMMVIIPEQGSEMLIDPQWIASHGFFYRVWIMVKNIGWIRGKYYLAWVMADLINNCAGLGYSGTDPKTGREKWSLCKNVDIRRLEMATSLKVNVESWNKLTALWLRRIVYDRVPSSINLYAVYFVSALWHGFYPGYYVTFFSVAFLTMAARKVRRNVRPFFQSSPQMAFLYDAITWTCTRIACPYLAAPFVFLSLRNTWTFYSSYFFFLHVGSALLILALPEGKSTRSADKKKSETTVKAEAPGGHADTTMIKADFSTLKADVSAEMLAASEIAVHAAEDTVETKKEL